MLNLQTIDSWKRWAKLLVFWAIHWNEPCGTLAIQSIIDQTDSWKIQLLQWSVTFVPICHPLAYEKWLRYIDKDLNRVFQKHTHPQTIEQKLANQLTKLIDQHDYVLDIHSTSEETEAFIFQDYDDPETKALCECFWCSYIITGWTEIYNDTHVSDTVGYTYKQWKKWVLIECWQHKNPQSQVIAEQSIFRFLQYFKLIDLWTWNWWGKQKYVHLTRVQYKEKSWELTYNYINFQKIWIWETIANYSDGEQIIAKHDFYMIMPNHSAKIWQEWYYEWVMS